MSETSELAKTYDPKQVEKTWYDFWNRNGYFRPESNPEGTPFTVTIPPPNVTGELHMGHALQHAIHDAVIRWKRMQGHAVLCLPGTDHAGIGTQTKVEEDLLNQEGKRRHDIGREKLLERVWAWKEKYGNTILRQLRDLGCSYDWSRERFTMDDSYVRAVLETFVRFQRKGWIYRGRRMVNWCPSCASVISDLEVEERELAGHLWHIRYSGVDGSPDVVVATTRPETMLGDTAVAVHPDDDRWKSAIGKQVMLPLMDRPIPIVADDYADPEMGSGAVKVTPSHDPNDYEIGKRHSFPEIQVIGLDAVMTEESGRFAGMDRYACRKAVVEELKALGLLEQVDDHTHAVPHHDRCGTVIEPLALEQWFVAMRDLADLMLPALRNGDIAYVPDRFRKLTIDWLENIQDGCISRQIWWGHRVPAWTHKETGEVVVQIEPPESPESYEQDPDVLDTWFSSALWPFATLGWPDETEDLATYFPTDLMITGRDILNLWVVRMVMTSLEFHGQIPFKTVFVHPTVQTHDGRRMSKSLGTGINPTELIDMYGTDATRFSLLYQCGSSQDIRFDAAVVDNVLQDSPLTEMCRNFCNKIWNAARFVQMNLDPEDLKRLDLLDLPDELDTLADRWIVSTYNRTIASVTESLEAYRFDEVSRTLYEFLWNTTCDWYLEIVKGRLNGPDEAASRAAQGVLVHVLEGTLRMLHPVMPFITEELWQKFPHRGESVMMADWPRPDALRLDDDADRSMALVQEVVGAIRNIRGAMSVPPGRRADVRLKTASVDHQETLMGSKDTLRQLARRETIEIGPDLERPPSSASAVVGDIEIYLPLEGLIDLELERSRLEKEIDRLEKAVDGQIKKLANQKFVERAPAEVVENERAKQVEMEATLVKVRESLKILTDE